MSRPDVDLLDPAFHVGDPHPAYRWMRQHEPVYRDEHNALWCITRMEHLRHVERSTDEFVSSQGYRSIWVHHETSMISKDDPEHAHQRRLVSDRFTPRAVARLEDDVRALVIDAISMFAFAGMVEVVDALAARIPSILTCRLIGWDDSHWRDVRSWSERLMRVDTMLRVPGHASDAMRAVGEIARLVDASLAQRSACPADDLLSAWLAGAEKSCPMSAADVNSELGLVIPGGAETTRTTLARALILFSERNDLWEQLAADPAGISTAVEELLRFITPLNNMFRTVASPDGNGVEIDGVRMAHGDRVALVYPSANRDESVFAEPDGVDLARDPNPHIAFGFGTHFCLGAHVARLVLRVALEELTPRFKNLRAVAPPVYEANVFVKAVERFEMGFDPR
ncbi:MAG TPA: cytochrome P450 [Acidimicrobiales bacterium]|nr:cytochrome P450 [Acidimicrobiales bacterium]